MIRAHTERKAEVSLALRMQDATDGMGPLVVTNDEERVVEMATIPAPDHGDVAEHAGGGNLLTIMGVVASESFTSTSAPIQYAAVRAFAGGPDIDDYLSCSRSVLRAVGPAVAARLRRAGCDLPDPEGGFYLFPDLSRLRGT